MYRSVEALVATALRSGRGSVNQRTLSARPSAARLEEDLLPNVFDDDHPQADEHHHPNQQQPVSTTTILPHHQQKQQQQQQLKPLAYQNSFRPAIAVPDKQYQLYSKSHIPKILSQYVSQGSLDPMPYSVAATVLPMRANNYVVEELIDWSNVPNDPIFQLVFPQPGMLKEDDLMRVQRLIEARVDRVTLRAAVQDIRDKMNPHPAGQKELNVPRVGGKELAGMQHKYRETLLFFPSEGQYCQSFCTYCFRWAQFTSVGSEQQFQSTDAGLLIQYLRENKGISDVLFTGGDPMVMTSRQWLRYLDPILKSDGLDHLATIRIGSKSLAYWPYRYISDPDADDILRLFERVVASGRNLAFQAHFSHPRELSTPAVQEAVRRLQLAGVTIRAQAPLINHVNADAETWTTMWRAQQRMGIIPYYMFVERDTGARHYFEVPLYKALEIYNKAVSSVSGVARTVRGPSMSAAPGKVHVVGVAELAGEKMFVLKFIQSRNPDWINQLFFAKYDEQAAWLDHLKPAGGEEKFFFEDELEQLAYSSTTSGVMFPHEEGFEYNNMLLN